MVSGGLLDPYRTLFAPLDVLYGTRFNSKHNITVQLANIYGERHNLPLFWTFLAPLDTPKGPYMSKSSCFEAPTIHDLAF